MADSFARRRSALAALGTDLTSALVDGTIAITSADLDPAIRNGVEVVADVPYGAHERQVLDVYRRADAPGTGHPVLLYVPGGGFVRGSKDSFGNVGAWAVQQGWVGAVMNYRLAPEAVYPCGAQDVAAAVTWVVQNIAAHGGDPGRILLVGQSAGAMHAADYIVGHGGPHGRAVAAAALISCLYDVGHASHRDNHVAYWGADTARWGGYATMPGLIDTDLPLLLAVSEFDEPEFQDHAARLVAAWHGRRGTYPPMHYLYGHNHLTPIYGIGTRWDDVGPQLVRFFDAATGPA